ncbi:MAG: hypothetical protein NWS90_08015 [Algoriphagus sp.]|jgi:hypothetical protein|uniref:hypothetical protein n=1 Tax=Algoriphagus sp. TaxID=1872435 RepID=UPI00274964ED|nr:hypothetical protein [Algoriphagus sp.]MDP4746888.1 hypothetical protein [Algoriphagus sp.]MDP4839887.1 hypothetical protein [Algoriphagus sp.]MDP4903851.1 hypothetical protein [Algoriphagus sp.]MDP4956604.1 hypothetical protein [Algoriphagus sp.]
MRKGLLIFLRIVLVVFVSILAYAGYQFRDRHSGYQTDVSLYRSADIIQAGFSKVDLTPIDFETWEDVDRDSKYVPEKGDRFVDANGNGEFDAIWLAGFHNSRPAQGVLDKLWARAMVLESGDVSLALCVIDMIGFGNDEVIATRKLIQEKYPGLDYVVISSTHVHSAPDLMGMWGPSEYVRGVNPDYMKYVQEGISKAIGEAYSTRRPAHFKFAQEPERLKDLVGDTRPPFVLDAGLQLMQVLDAQTGSTLGTLMNWGNHPETLWLENIQISSDFADPWRNFVEDGIPVSDNLTEPGVGGVAIFLNGAVGGLMTTHPDQVIKDPYTGIIYQEQTPEKLLAQGKALAKVTLETLNDSSLKVYSSLDLGIRARSISLAMDNSLFQLAAFVGIFDRGFVGWKKIRSEISAWKLGPATFVHVPGELYPEILHGGIESPNGADFKIDPVEVPALKEKIPGQYIFFSGMSNDMIGYIVPKSQWDVNPPFSYDYQDRPYGEINSLGPETAPKIHGEVLSILKDLQLLKK